MTLKYAREVETQPGKTGFGTVRLQPEEQSYLMDNHITFSEFCHSRFRDAIYKTKQKKISRFINNSLLIVLGLVLMSVSILIPRPFHLIGATAALFLIVTGIILAWTALKIQ